MQEKSRRFIKSVYSLWKKHHYDPGQAHPDAVTFACFFEGSLSKQESHEFKQHIVLCVTCAEKVAAHVSLGEFEHAFVPPELLLSLRSRLSERISRYILEIWLILKSKTLKLLDTTGKVLSGDEFIPAAVLRSSKTVEFQDELIVCNEFNDLRVEIRIENKYPRNPRVSVLVKDMSSKNILQKETRVALVREGVEVESYAVVSGKACFEDVVAGNYTLVIFIDNEAIASILLNMQVA
ncbi:MAG: hypothetical protein WDL87_08455 [Candidatus Omnitrophota bacterium]|jgi:hypothetical protein